MIKKSIPIEISNNSDVTPIAMIVQIASQYDSKIYIECENKSINAKSIMGMMTLIIKKGDELVVNCDGADENEALTALEGYLSNK